MGYLGVGTSLISSMGPPMLNGHAIEQLPSDFGDGDCGTCLPLSLTEAFGGGGEELERSASGVDQPARVLILQGVLPITAARIPAEILAGITLAEIAIPEVMGYTKISGTRIITADIPIARSVEPW